MPIYVTLLQYTEKGVLHVKDTVKREEAYKKRAKKHGVTVKEIIWTQGAHDIVMVFEAPDDETATAFILSAEELAMFAARPCAASRLPRWKSYWQRSTSDLSSRPRSRKSAGDFALAPAQASSQTGLGAANRPPRSALTHRRRHQSRRRCPFPPFSLSLRANRARRQIASHWRVLRPVEQPAKGMTPASTKAASGLL